MQKVYRRVADTILLFHIFVVVIVLFGWLLSKKYFWIYQTTVILTFLFGLLNRGTCILTKYEWNFRRKYHIGSYDDNLFLPYYFKKYFNVHIPQRLWNISTISIITVSFIIQTYKLLT